MRAVDYLIKRITSAEFEICIKTELCKGVVPNLVQAFGTYLDEDPIIKDPLMSGHHC